MWPREVQSLSSMQAMLGVEVEVKDMARLLVREMVVNIFSLAMVRYYSEMNVCVIIPSATVLCRAVHLTGHTAAYLLTVIGQPD